MFIRDATKSSRSNKASGMSDLLLYHSDDEDNGDKGAPDKNIDSFIYDVSGVAK